MVYTSPLRDRNYFPILYFRAPAFHLANSVKIENGSHCGSLVSRYPKSKPVHVKDKIKKKQQL